MKALSSAQMAELTGGKSGWCVLGWTLLGFSVGGTLGAAVFMTLAAAEGGLCP